MTAEPAVLTLLAEIDARLGTARESTARLAILIEAGRRLARDLQAIDVVVGLPLMYDLDDAAHALADLDVADPHIDLPSVTGEQAREALRTVLHVLAEQALADDLPDGVRAVAARAGADAADACIYLVEP